MNLWRCHQDSDLLFRHAPSQQMPYSHCPTSIGQTSHPVIINIYIGNAYRLFRIFASYFQSYIPPLSKKKQICSKNIPTTSPLSNERIGLNDKIHSYREIHFPLIIAPSSLQILLFGIFTAVFCVFLQYFSKNNRFFVVSFWFLPTKPYICGNISMKSNIIPLIIKT